MCNMYMGQLDGRDEDTGRLRGLCANRTRFGLDVRYEIAISVMFRVCFGFLLGLYSRSSIIRIFDYPDF